jgi:hypothetical protein
MKAVPYLNLALTLVLTAIIFQLNTRIEQLLTLATATQNVALSTTEDPDLKGSHSTVTIKEQINQLITRIDDMQVLVEANENLSKKTPSTDRHIAELNLSSAERSTAEYELQILLAKNKIHSDELMQFYASVAKLPDSERGTYYRQLSNAVTSGQLNLVK